ncbi:MAG: hypothetical protein CR997_01710 [Acidobacteria bacterium]|nr:MAG: hypothetical protein CR997_01710 [Acidobacteriota bacterium]
MKKKLIQCILGLGFVLTAMPTLAQQTSTIAGKVSSDDGTALPGVVVNLESDRLQGTRSSVSREDGSFLFKLLPPGTYTLTASMAGMKTFKKTINVGLGQTNRPRVVLSAEEIEEAMVVTASAKESITDTTEVGTNVDFEEVDELPAGRSINSVVSLSPGVTNGGPSGNIQISGGQSFENLFMINGVVVNENVRGQPHQAYVEDAIQEVSVLTGAISAEYGNFTGGVVNTITKSGGNEFSGSFRAHFDNDAWMAKRPNSNSQPESNLNHVESFTLGGPILKDRLWFFTSGRKRDDETENYIPKIQPMTNRQVRYVNRLGYELAEDQTTPDEQYWPHTIENERIEIKLTGLIGTDHTIVGSYLFANTDEYNNMQRTALHPRAVDPFRSMPNTLMSINYRGIITPELTIDALYSQKQFTFEKSGGDDYTLSGGTPIIYAGLNLGAPMFSEITDEERDNETLSLKFSYYLSTENWGSHDIVAGATQLTEILKADNHQSGSDWTSYASYVYFDDNNEPIPLFLADGGSYIYYWPILKSSQGSDFKSQALFINDSWVLNDNWRFSLGLRYDKNNTKAQDGTLLSDSDMISPRMAVTYDFFGDGRHNVAASFGRYVAKIANVADGLSAAGTPAIIGWTYAGEITDNLGDLFNWFETTYGVNLADGQGALFQSGALKYARQVTIPGGTTLLPETLESPLVDEYTIGYSAKLGNRGVLRLDYVHREYDKFYVDRVVQGTDPVEIPGTGDFDDNGQMIPGTGDFTDMRIMDNSDGEYTREYDSVQTQFQFNWDDKWNAGMNYTWSQLTGNIVGETRGSGSISSSSNTTYVEIKDYENYNPPRYLSGDMRHKVDMWVGYDLGTSFGDFNFSALYKFQSAPVSEGYYLTWSISRNGPSWEDFGLVDPASLGYLKPPDSVSYFVKDRDRFTANDFSRIDLAINYSLQIKRVEFFIEFEVFNLFNQSVYLGSQPNVSVDTSTVNPNEWFNVYTEEPIEGVHYIISNDNVQRPPTGFQTPRWYQFDVGFKF